MNAHPGGNDSVASSALFAPRATAARVLSDHATGRHSISSSTQMQPGMKLHCISNITPAH